MTIRSRGSPTAGRGQSVIALCFVHASRWADPELRRWTTMTSSEPLSDKSVASVADAIFAKGGPTVVEAWSEFGSEPRHFVSAAEICAYATEKRGGKPGSVHLAVHYPDTAGRLVQKRVSLNPGACDGSSHRFTFEGWGLIWVYLHLAGANAADSFVSANTQKRAEKWGRSIRNRTLHPTGIGRLFPVIVAGSEMRSNRRLTNQSSRPSGSMRFRSHCPPPAAP